MSQDEGALAAYASWWASVEHPIGFSAYVIVATVVMYYVLLQNYVGLEFCVIGLRLRRGLEVVPDPLDKPYYGWRVFVQLMKTVAVSMMLTGIALGTFLIILPSEAYVWIAPPLVLWVFGGLFYVFTPVVMLRPAIRRWRKRVIDEARAAAKLSANESAVAEEALMAEADAVEKRVKRISVLPLPHRVLAIIGYSYPLVSAGADVIGRIL